MSRILLFAGTSEGRRLSEWLCEMNTDHELCVATQYGEQVLNEHPCARVFSGRMEEAEISEFMKLHNTQIVVDATHPYAKEVTDNIREAALKENVKYIRLDRNSEDAGQKKETAPEAEKLYFDSARECAKALALTGGNILLTTGSKELAVYCSEPSLRERIIVRVLPGRESIEICEENGILGKQIIAMQGPFSLEMNRALIHAYDIKVMVSKLSGKRGGYFEKEAAAALENIPMYLIGRPDNSKGACMEQVKKELGPYISKRTRIINLIGCGMGHRQSMTEQALKALDSSKLVFGAKRLIGNAICAKRIYPYYLAKDIIPILKETEDDAAVLFSGDTGFYSGTEKLHRALTEEIKKGMKAEIRIYPGISSISNLAALAGISWEDAKIISTHGRGDFSKWEGRLLSSVRENKKTFMILSGVNDLNDIGRALSRHDLGETVILAGYQMSYPEEEFLRLSPEECEAENKEGLYAIFIINENAKGRTVSHGLPDSEFIRDKVPMTKEEVREVCISKLRLRNDSVVYDIGSGTGSIAIEIARLSSEIRVYAIERKPEAAELIRKNIEKFGLSNIEVVEAYAPMGLEGLERPTHAFIGGSGGNMNEILEALFEKNRNIRVCANAVSLETMEELINIEKEFDVEEFSMVSMQVTRTGKVGAYNMLRAENPIWICSFKGK